MYSLEEFEGFYSCAPGLEKRVDVFALSLYGLIVFPKVLGYIDEAVSDLFDRLDKGTTPVPAILAETFRSLNTCRRAGEGRFIGCAQLLLAWFHSHFWKVEKVSYRVFSKDYSPLRELVATSRRDDISEERCGDFDWVPLVGIWGAIGYAPLMVLRQYRSRQFIPVTQGLAQCEFPYKDNNYKKRVREISDAWNQTRRMKGFTAGPMTTPEYEWWWGRRVNDNIPRQNQGNTQPIEEHLRFQDARVREDTLKKSLLETQNEKEKLQARVAELERLLQQHRSHNSIIKLKASLSRIEELKGKIEELETALRDSKIRVKLLETNNDHYREQLHHSQNQIRDRNYVMGEAIAQVREIADHLQTLAVQADIFSLKYELESD
ncbi:uncharacterized protein LOC128289418 [Gossypium arboreum]|uniref:uncharacterized protein LOC128289418 n=1 Tax=Gossypium arboreum TaxID=29729 RepID=UPI0022F18172|nr:uncharacterized protein LOC128289418 [Gossypium arboreum]